MDKQLRYLQWLLLALSLGLHACAAFQSAESRKALKIKQVVEHSTVFSKGFTGFTLIDPNTGKTLVDVQGDHYFTPASNTKILTLAACLEVLGDSIPRLKHDYVEDNSTGEGMGFLWMSGTGDPTFLHPQFQAWQPKPEFLKAHPYAMKVLGKRAGFSTQPVYGSGWAWDDFPEQYSCEITSLPVYGNQIEATWNQRQWDIRPAFFQDSIVYDAVGHSLKRRPFSSVLAVPSDHVPAGYVSVTYPIFGAEALAPKLVADSLSIRWEVLETDENKNMDVYGAGMQSWNVTPIDTVLRRMMHQSDNFIAEQMLLLCAGEKFDYLQQDTMIRWMLDSVFTTLPHRPKWVDGSGLSRYNLITPQDITQILLRLWKTQPRERLFSLFPAGGVNGTIENWYAGKSGKPYVFAKTGTMGGVHCLSGYIVCNSGKVLIFSFMHNNFVGPSKPWKQEMQRILELVAAM